MEEELMTTRNAAEECSHRPAECPCCSPPTTLPFCDVLKHVKERLLENSQHDRMSKLLIRLSKENKKLREEHAGIKASAAAVKKHAADELRQEKAKLTKDFQQDKSQLARERREWHAHRDQNDNWIQRNRSLMFRLCELAGACRAHIIYNNCEYGEECKWKHCITVANKSSYSGW